MAPRAGKEATLKGIRRRQPRAFEELLTEHLDALFRTALRLCGGREADAEDLLQDTALRALERYGQLRDPSAARAWLFTILTRTHYNRVRSARRRAETTFADLAEGAFEAALAAWRPLPTPADVMDRRLIGDQLGTALNQLPLELRSAVWLVDVEGFTQREVAAMQEVPEGTIASRLFRARRHLRDVLAPGAEEGEGIASQIGRRKG